MRIRPILFSGPMVRALIEGRKTQTRRVVKPQPPTPKEFPGRLFGLTRAVAPEIWVYSLTEIDRLPKHPTDWELHGSVGVARDSGYPRTYRCPYGACGDLLWVRETCSQESDGTWIYRADGEFLDGCTERRLRWRPSIHMPRSASRVTLRLTDIRVEHLQEIDEAQAKAEGARFLGAEQKEVGTGYRTGFRALWDSINSRRGFGFDTNPWVWALEFEVIRRNVGELAQVATVPEQRECAAHAPMQ